MIVIYFILYIVGLVISRSRSIVYTPSTLFIGSWLLVLILFQLDPILFSEFTYIIPDTIHSYRLVSLFSFLVGTSLVWLNFPIIKEQSIELEGIEIQKIEAFFKILMVGFSIGTIIRIYIIIKTYGLSIAIALPSIRSDFVSGDLKFPLISSLGTLFANLLALNLGYLFGLGRSVGKWIIAFVMLSVINDSTMGDKAGLRLILILVISAYYTRKFVLKSNFIGVWKYVVAIFFALGFYSVITFFRVKEQSASIMDVTFGHFYVNIVGNIASSSYFIEHPWPNDYFGAYSFSDFYNLFGLNFSQSHVAIEESSFFNANITTSGGIYNTTDYLAFLYADFGINGIILISFILGCVTSYLFLLAKCKSSLNNIFFLSYFTGALLICVRGFYFGAPGFWITLLLIPLQVNFLKFFGKRIIFK